MGSTECCCQKADEFSTEDVKITDSELTDAVKHPRLAQPALTDVCLDERQESRKLVTEEPVANGDNVEYLLGRSPKATKWKTPKVGRSPGGTLHIVQEEGLSEEPELILEEHLQKWGAMAQCEIATHVEATKYFAFEIYFSQDLGRCSVSPENLVVFFRSCHQYWLRQASALLKMCLVHEEDLPSSVSVGGVVSNHQGDTATMKGDFVQFELIYEALDDPSTLDRDILPNIAMLPLSLTAGPSRINPDTQQFEFIRTDLGRCLRNRITDQVATPSDSAVKLFRSRWWICLELIKFVCRSNRIDTSSLSKSHGAPLPWVMCLMSGSQSLSPTCSLLSSPEHTSSASENLPLLPSTQ
jgi:hypothetical protein